MKLAKPCLDVGLFTMNKDALLRFYQEEVGLPFEELLPLGGGAQQHRHGMNGSVLKINHQRDPLPALPSCGYTQLSIASNKVSLPTCLTDPDGNAVRLIPIGFDNITGVLIDMQVRNVEAHLRFWRDAMGATVLSARRVRLGTTVLAFRTGATQSTMLDMRAPGFRYLTVQVYDVAEEHTHVLKQGGIEGRAPAVLGQVAKISFVRDPDGNWIEISQRKSLTGSLA